MLQGIVPNGNWGHNPTSWLKLIFVIYCNIYFTKQTNLAKPDSFCHGLVYITVFLVKTGSEEPSEQLHILSFDGYYLSDRTDRILLVAYYLYNLFFVVLHIMRCFRFFVLVANKPNKYATQIVHDVLKIHCRTILPVKI